MPNNYNYRNAGFDDMLKRAAPPPPEITEDAAQIERPQIPTETVKGDIPQEQIEKAVNDIVRLSQVTTESLEGLPTGFTISLTSTISDLIYPDKVMLAVAEITPYDGTLGSSNAVIKPNADWRIDTGYDFQTNALLSSNGKSLTAYQRIYNESGSTKNIYWYIRWRFSGTNTAA